MTEAGSAPLIDRWKRSLLDLTLRNRLLDARDGRTSVALAGCDPVALAALLDGGVELAVDPVAAAPTEDEAAEALARHRVLVAVDAAELDRSLVAMARAARESLEEGGAHTLWIALGALRWTDGDGGARHAPLALWPVEVRRARTGDRYRLVPTGDEPRLNETLIEKLRVDLGVTVALPGDDPEEDGVDVAAIVEAFTRAIGDRDGWAVVRAARLAVLSFTKFAMWTDLASRADDLLARPLCRHLAEATGAPFADAGDAGDGLDGDDPLAHCPLDADATQLAAVRAAGAGQTFVLQGPPGTGKSQTISNLIAHCLARGKTVLLVSEKMAALEVVQRRLAGAGLGDFCLELHSHRASKRAVLDALGRVLDRAWRPGGGPGDDAKLAATRRALDDYAAALHEPSPLGVTVHDALARLVALRDAGVPALDVGPDPAAGASGAGWLGARRDAVAQYAGAWNAARHEPGEHPWRDSELADWQLSTRDAVTAVLAELDAAVDALARGVAEAAGAVPGVRATTRDDIDALGAVAAIAARPPRRGRGWRWSGGVVTWWPSSTARGRAASAAAG
jgi:hypothetical protein